MSQLWRSNCLGQAVYERMRSEAMTKTKKEHGWNSCCSDAKILPNNRNGQISLIFFRALGHEPRLNVSFHVYDTKTIKNNFILIETTIFGLSFCFNLFPRPPASPRSPRDPRDRRGTMERSEAEEHRGLKQLKQLKQFQHVPTCLGKIS